jgi:hypothetical protein
MRDMTLTDDVRKNWRSHLKQASAATATTAEMVKAFSDQAWALLRQSAEPLMQAPYWKGFELVSDEGGDHTRMAGVTVFNVGEELLLVPALFIDGEVKGQEIIYQTSTKLFRPLDPEWAAFLADGKRKDPIGGDLISRGDTMRDSNLQELWKIAVPPQALKAASVEMLHALSNSVSVPEIYGEFFAESGLSPRKFHEALTKKCSISKNYADAAFGTDTVERLKPVVEKSEAKAKQASVREPDFTVMEHVPMEKIPVKSLNLWLHDGYAIVDHRKTAGIEVVELDDGSTNFETVNQGVYKLVLRDMKEVEAEVFPCVLNQNGENDTFGVDRHTYPTDRTWVEENQNQGIHGTKFGRSPVVVVTKDGHATLFNHSGEIVGRKLNKETLHERVKPENIKEGKWLLLVGGKSFGVFDVYGVKKEGDLVFARTTSFSPDRWSWVINKDLPTSSRNGVIGYDAELVKVESGGGYDSGSTVFADANTASQALALQQGFRIGSVDRDGSRYVVTFSEHGREKKASWADPKSVVLNLAAFTGLPAELWQEKVSALQPGQGTRLGAFAKEASQYPVVFNNDPEFTESFNELLGIRQQDEQTFMIGSTRQQDTPPRATIGDGWDPTSGEAYLRDMKPEQIAAFAQEADIPQLFDHGAVASLVKHFDMDQIMTRTEQKLAEGVDSLCRLYFLCLWKPEEFKRVFGDEEYDDKVGDMRENIKRMGETLLTVKRRNNEKQSGTIGFDKWIN